MGIDCQECVLVNKMNNKIKLFAAEFFPRAGLIVLVWMVYATVSIFWDDADTHIVVLLFSYWLVTTFFSSIETAYQSGRPPGNETKS